MVQTRSQPKGVKAPTRRELTCSMQKKVKDIKPIIIEDDDDQDISNLNKENVVTNKEVSSYITPPKVFAKQVDIDKILNIIKRKVLKGTHLPLTIKEIQAGYLSSSFFKDVFVYLACNRLPNKKSAM